MKLNKFYAYSIGVSALVLALMFSAVLLHTFLGARLKQICSIGGLLLLCNLALLAFALQFTITVEDEKQFTAYLWYNTATASFADLTFGVSHYLLAYIYRKISIEHP